MKKVLVLTLALVMAIAGSAMAAIEIGGEFGAKVEQDILTWGEDVGVWTEESKEFTFLKGDFEYGYNFKLNMKSSSDTWSLNVNFKNKTNDVTKPFAELDNTGYTLKINDDLFNVMVWQGSTNHQGYVNDPFSLIRARRSNSDTKKAIIRAKANIMDVADLTLQLDQGSSVYAFVTGEVAGVDLGLAAQRKFGTEVFDTAVIHAGYDFEVAKVTAGAGMSFDNTPVAENETRPELKDRLAYAAKVEVPVTDEIKAEASYVVKQKDWKGNGSNSAAATVKGTYTADALEVEGSFSTTGKHVNTPEAADNRTTTIALGGTYNFTEDIEVGLEGEYKIDKDKKGLVNEEDIKTTKLSVNVSAPIIADLLSVEASAGYTSDNTGAILVGNYLYVHSDHGTSGETLRNASSLAFAKTLFEAEAKVKVTPIEKLTVTPSVAYKNFKDGYKKDADILAYIRELREPDHGDYQGKDLLAGSVLTLKAEASYEVGAGATVTLTAGNNAYNFTEIFGVADGTLKYNNPFASLAVKVKF